MSAGVSDNNQRPVFAFKRAFGTRRSTSGRRPERSLALSFRSTEFIDDAARDNEATNKLEINDFGFAFGQLADRETRYAKLKKLGF
jgi:hypothetical protein